MSLLDSRHSCMPCTYGEHKACRHHPDKDGSSWYTDEKTGERRLMLRERYTKKELPRPPCQCEQGSHVGEPGTCSARINTEWSFHRCGKPAKGMLTKRGTWTYDETGGRYQEVTIEACGIHLAAARRRAAGDAKREAEWEAKQKEWAAEETATQASHEWARRIKAEFGLPVEGMDSDADKPRVEMHPERAYKILDEVRSMLDEVYGDDHPFARKN